MKQEVCGCKGIYLAEINEIEDVLRRDCLYCMEQFKYAKKHKLRVVWNDNSKDVLGVEIVDKKIKKRKAEKTQSVCWQVIGRGSSMMRVKANECVAEEVA